MLTVGFIALEFPPLNTGGSQRPLKWVKHMSSHGIQSVVFTVTPDAYPAHQDQGMSDEIPDDVPVFRSDLSTPSFSDRLKDNAYLSIADRWGNRWSAELIKQLRTQIQQHNISVLYVTAPPFSMIQLGAYLASHFDLPTLLDLRDGWSEWNLAPYASQLHYNLTVKAEHKAFEQFEAIVLPTDGLLKNYTEKYPDLTSKFHRITNSFEHFIAKFVPVKFREQKIIKIAYAGSFYYDPKRQALMDTSWYKKKPHQWLHHVARKEDWKYRSPYYFFKTIRRLIENHVEYAKRIEIHFAGKKEAWLQNMVQEFDLEKIVKFKGFLSKAEMQELYNEAHALLLTSVKVENGEDYCIAAKTFDYFAHQKPIIGVVTSGSQQKALDESGLHVHCDPDDVEQGAEALHKLFEDRTELSPDLKGLAAFQTKNTSTELAEVLFNIAGKQ